jgi:hypothetical protein
MQNKSSDYDRTTNSPNTRNWKQHIDRMSSEIIPKKDINISSERGKKKKLKRPLK